MGSIFFLSMFRGMSVAVGVTHGGFRVLISSVTRTAE
jgi:hypothetical protein